MKVIITAGGTGGHIYPALSIIKELKTKNKECEILYIGTTDRMEKDIVPKYNIPYYGIKIRGFDRKVSLKNIDTIKCLLISYLKVKKIIKNFKPDIVIGVGGYVTAPVLYAAAKCKVKTIIHEQNSVLGMTNKFLSKYVDAVAISFPDTSVNARKIVYTGNPCAEVDTSLKFDKSELKLSKNKKLVLIVMGSLGSKVISDKMKEILPKFNDKNYEILFITGKSYYDEFNSLKLNSNIFVIPFLDNLKKILKYVDVMVSRAGATTISEIIAYKIPSILIPSPHVTDNHQYKNALNLFDKNASLLIEEKNLNSDILIKNIEYLLYDKISVLKMKDNLKSMQIKGSASKIYNLIIELTGE